MSNLAYLCHLLLCLSWCLTVPSLHLTGTWKPGEFFKFFAKFGFQKADKDNPDTKGYIYGNITSNKNTTTGVMFVVVDSEYFLEYYANRTLLPRSEACPVMFKKIETIAWEYNCNPEGKEDFLRNVPCERGKLCKEEDDPKMVIPGYQFTYNIEDIVMPRFWFVSAVSCYITADTCVWKHTVDDDLEIYYDIWFVNGNPDKKHINPFEHQFSFEQHDVLEVHVVFFVLYTILVPLQIYALTKKLHPITKLLTTCMVMEYIGAFSNVIHVVTFAFNGVGVEPLRIAGNFVDTMGQCFLVMLLLLIAKGWTITKPELSHKYILFGVWGLYTLIYIFLFIWNLTEIDVISDIDEWQTWPGYLILGFRMCIMAWFFFELLHTFSAEMNREKVRFYLHFGAGFLVWFTYLPILVLIGMNLSALWRFKTMLSIMYGADFLAFAVLTHLMWPSRSALYFDLEERFGRKWDMSELEITGLLSDDEDNVYESMATAPQSDYEEDQTLWDKNVANGDVPKTKNVTPQNNGIVKEIEETEF